jgi:hypothetical protein
MRVTFTELRSMNVTLVATPRDHEAVASAVKFSM